MRSGYLIEKYSDMGEAYTCKRLVEEAEKAGFHLTLVGVRDCVITPAGVFHKGELLSHRDFAILRYKQGKVMEEIRALCDYSYNSPACFDRYVNKFYQLKDLEGSKLCLPSYQVFQGKYPFEQLKNDLGLPFVLKGLSSSMGREIHLVEDERSYEQILSQYPEDKEYLAEEFIAESRGRDLRLFALRGHVIGAMIRSSADDFRSNVALGAKVTRVSVTAEMEEIAKELFIRTGYDAVGIDLLFGKRDGKEKLIFCEMNVMPGIQGMEEATGKNIAGALIQMIKEDFGEA